MKPSIIKKRQNSKVSTSNIRGKHKLPPASTHSHHTLKSGGQSKTNTKPQDASDKDKILLSISSEKKEEAEVGLENKESQEKEINEGGSAKEKTAYEVEYEGKRRESNVWVCNPCCCCTCCNGCCNLRRNLIFIGGYIYFRSGVANFLEFYFVISKLGKACPDNDPLDECGTFKNISSAIGGLWIINGMVSIFISVSILVSIFIPEKCERQGILWAKIASYSILGGMSLTIRYILCMYLAWTGKEIIYEYLFGNPISQFFLKILGWDEDVEANKEVVDSFILKYVFLPLLLIVILVLIFESWFVACVFQYRKQLIAGISREPCKKPCEIRRGKVGAPEDPPPAFDQ